MKIKVISSSWSGDSRNYTPKEEETLYEIQLNKKYTVLVREFSDTEGNKGKEEIFSFEITQIGDDYISIHCFQPFSVDEKGINLMGKKQDFTININKPIRLITLTIDYGDIFTLSLVK